mgnify:CR=1 FL=1
METTIKGSPAFGRIEVTLGPTESIVAESDAMANMAGDLDMTARFNGGFFSGLSKKFLGKESLFETYPEQPQRCNPLSLV